MERYSTESSSLHRIVNCQYVIEDELENIILKLNAKTPDYLNLISTCLVKKNVHQNILQPLTTDNVRRCSFQTGVFLSILKIARVTTIFEKGERYIVSNYRPVCCLNSTNY